MGVFWSFENFVYFFQKQANFCVILYNLTLSNIASDVITFYHDETFYLVLSHSKAYPRTTHYHSINEFLR